MKSESRDFRINEFKFHLNDNPWKGQFECKYNLMMWSNQFNSWVCICGADSKSEARKLAIEYLEVRGWI